MWPADDEDMLIDTPKSNTNHDDDDGLSTSNSSATYSSERSIGLKLPLRETWGQMCQDNQRDFHTKESTVLVIDWDDTLFPCTWLYEDCQLDCTLPLADQVQPSLRTTLIKSLLNKFVPIVEEFLEAACANATVFIVTLARRPWVDTCTVNLIPGLKEVLDKCQVKVIYAQEYADTYTSMSYDKDQFETDAEMVDLGVKAKTAAISKELAKYHAETGISWKNVISLGDSDFERQGTITAGKNYMEKETQSRSAYTPRNHTQEGLTADGLPRRLRTKTVKMLDDPTIEELLAQLKLFKRWLPYMVARDGSFDIELKDTTDDETLIALHKFITGREEVLSWPELAGMAS